MGARYGLIATAMISSISEQELTPRQSDLWVKACQSVNTKNYPYAISLLKALIKEAPGFLEGRKVLRACAVKQNSSGAKRSSLFSGMRMTSMKKTTEVTLVSVEDDLEKDPYSILANTQLHKAAMEAGLKDTATFALETICQGNPQNKKYLHMLASHLVQCEDFEKAAETYRRILEIDRADSVAIKGEKDCAARASMRAQNWENARGFRDVMKNSQETSALESGDKVGMTRAELEQRLAQLSEQYSADQTNLAVVRDIAATYERLEDWEHAYAYYNYAFSLSANDVSLNAKATEMHDNLLNAELAALEKAAAESPENEELQSRLAAKRKEHAQSFVKECRLRLEGNPTDPQLHFNLGNALFQADEYSEAIPELQRARNNPFLRTKAMLMLGKCYGAKNMNDMAIRQLQEASGELLSMDATKKEVLYLMGQLYEKMGKPEEALEQFKAIYEADYGYMDVAERVEAAYGG